MPFTDHVFLIEDDAGIHMTLTKILEFEGFRVIGASDGLQALKILENGTRPPSVIILDLMMPIMDGWQFRQTQLKNPNLADIPTLIATAGEKVCCKTLRIEPDQLVKKPFEIDSFVNKVRRHMTQKDGGELSSRTLKICV